jgi:catechol 2,3-dioxygenase-like lactoylglutathione lyase family enzyme
MTRPDLFLVEIVVSDFARSVAWYRDALGLTVTLLDEPTRFALLRGAGVGQLALKGGSGSLDPDGVRLHLFQPDLDAALERLVGLGVVPDGPPRVSHEGYRSATLRDPDGYRVYLFEWGNPP